LRVDELHQRQTPERVPSGGQGSGIGPGIVVKGYRLKAIVACPAVPEIRDAAWTVLYPLGGGDWLAALGAGILFGQIAEISSGHGASPFAFVVANWTGLLPDKSAPPAVYNSSPAICLLNGRTIIV
jgi:hypothetical protein